MLIVDAQIHLCEKVHRARTIARSPIRPSRRWRAWMAAGVDRALIHPVLWDPDSNELAVEAVRQYRERCAIMGWFYLDDPNSRDLVAHWKERPAGRLRPYAAHFEHPERCPCINRPSLILGHARHAR
jgi:hypothetical protein